MPVERHQHVPRNEVSMNQGRVSKSVQRAEYDVHCDRHRHRAQLCDVAEVFTYYQRIVEGWPALDFGPTGRRSSEQQARPALQVLVEGGGIRVGMKDAHRVDRARLAEIRRVNGRTTAFSDPGQQPIRAVRPGPVSESVEGRHDGGGHHP